MELQDDLDAYVLDDEELAAAERASESDDYAVEAPPDADKANGMLRSLRGIERELRRIDMLATQEISRISSWREDRSFGLQRRRAGIEKALEAWMRAVNRLTPKRKSEALPNGKVALRAPSRSVDVYDATAFMAWWRENTRMEVAKYLRDRLAVPGVDFDGLGVDDFSAELVELVLSRSPLVKIKPEPSKSGIKEAGEQGARLDVSTEETSQFAVVIDGELVPGVVFSMPAVDTFNVSL